MKLTSLGLLMALWFPAFAASAADETASRRAPDGFAASMLLTSDADWRAKWNTPTSTTPEFTRVDSVKRGTPIWLLVFFANAKTDAAGAAQITCDIRFTRPDGKIALDQKDVSCLRGKLGSSPRNVFLAAQNIEFNGDAGDPTGTWQVGVTVRDRLRGTGLPLFTTFTLRD
ncbi:MAG: hypothetical protein ABW136_00585 [Steroidobacteraceae bacterium]